MFATFAPLNCLPADGLAGTLVGRVWLPKTSTSSHEGPCVVVLRREGVFDLTSDWPTMSDLLEEADPTACILRAQGDHIGSVEMLLQQTLNQNETKAHFIASCDLQVIKAAGVTFAASLVERVIEEQAIGNPLLALKIRSQVMQIIGGSLTDIIPGTSKAKELKDGLHNSLPKGVVASYFSDGGI